MIFYYNKLYYIIFEILIEILKYILVLKRIAEVGTPVLFFLFGIRLKCCIVATKSWLLTKVYISFLRVEVDTHIAVYVVSSYLEMLVSQRRVDCCAGVWYNSRYARLAYAILV